MIKGHRMKKQRSKGGRNPSESSRGNAAIEFAILLPFLLMIVIAALDFGLVEFNKIYVRSAVNAGVASAMGVSAKPASVQTAIQNSTPLTGLTITVSQFCQCADNSAVSCTGTCAGASPSPDLYLNIIVQKNVSLSGIYSFVPNPYPITEQAKVMLQ